MHLYSNKSSNDKYNSQSNLEGRTHYVDEGTLKFHHSRIVYSDTFYDGLMFGIVESVAVDMHNTKREFRPVLFDLFGTVIDRPDLGEGYRTSSAAITALREKVSSLNAKKVTLDGYKQYKSGLERQDSYTRELLKQYKVIR